jgi:hypothetical protein
MRRRTYRRRLKIATILPEINSRDNVGCYRFKPHDTVIISLLLGKKDASLILFLKDFYKFRSAFNYYPSFSKDTRRLLEL